MSRDLYDCTAAELATHSVEYLDYDTSPRDAAVGLDENGYDAAQSTLTTTQSKQETISRSAAPKR